MIKLEENEKLIAVFRKHNFYLAIKTAGLAFLGFLPLVLSPIFAALYDFGKGENFIHFLLFLYFIYLTILWIAGFVVWTNFYLDMWILTDKSIINVKQQSLFSREISNLRLDHIQDIKVEVIGMLNTLLHIGTVHVQTAGNEKEFVISQVKAPNNVKELILSAYHKQAEKIKTVKIHGGETAIDV